MHGKYGLAIAGAVALAAAFAPGAAAAGRVALQTWNTAAEFKNITVTAPDGRVLWSGLPDPSACPAPKEGKWTVDGGVLRQSDDTATDTALVFGDPSWGDIVFRAKARRLFGKEGFVMHVRERNPGHSIYANYGGWNDRAHGLETRGPFDFKTPLRTCDDYQVDVSGHEWARDSKLYDTHKPIENDRWYDLEVSCTGERVTMKIDGKAIFADVPVPEIDMAADKTEIEVDCGKARFPMAQDMWGIFFEDIDLSLDGGVYAEMVRNRSFEDDPVRYRKQSTIGFWNTVGRATIERDSSKPLSPQNRHCARVEALPGGGVSNDGYFGMAVRAGAKYRFSAALRGKVEGPLEVSLETMGKPPLAKGTISGIGAGWKTFTLELEANATDSDAKLVFRAPRGGEFWMDCVSLFPQDTYGKSGLFRKDLMERLAALKPAFVRFPGGCWVEGNTMAEAYRWKTTIGNKWDRRTQWNLWGYWSANGVGFHEYLLLAEELGAKALFCINTGMSHRENVPMDKMGEFVQDALDCIEYANGPATSEWGAVRAANGHPEPFNLEYLEIGNENGRKAYYERYALIHDAVRAKYPEIKIVSGVWKGSVTIRPQHIRDEHYYKTPDWFMTAGSSLYGRYPRGKFEVFVGEYAAIEDVGKWGDLRAAIAEAAFMCSLERNADVVKMAAYAPLFANAKHASWTPDMIYIANDGNFVSPSWHVQKLFGENTGAEVLDFRETSPWIKAKNGKRCRAVAASALRRADGAVIVKAVNCSEKPQPLTIALKGAAAASARKTVFTGPGAKASNSPLDREAMKEVSAPVRTSGGKVSETLPPLSLSVYIIETQTKKASAK